MPVVFWSEVEAATYGRYAGPPSREELEKLSSWTTPTAS
jgi:hypothetical protein